MKEKWKSISGYEGLYIVSNYGRVKSKDRLDSLGRSIKGKERATTFRNGYESIALHKDGKRYFTGIHRLVAKAFIENPNDLLEVNHKDGDKANNRHTNLEWVTRRKNIQHAYDNGLNEGCILAVYQYDLDGNFVKSYKSMTQAEKETGIPNSNISEICNNGKQKTAGGFQWSFEYKENIGKHIPYLGVGTEILQYSTEGNFIAEHKSMNSAMKKTGTNSGSIHACLSGKQKQSNGFIWKRK